MRTYSEGGLSSPSAVADSTCTRFLVFCLGSIVVVVVAAGGCDVEEWAGDLRFRSKGEARCWIGGSELLMSGSLLKEEGPEPNVCANEGRDWGDWVAMSVVNVVNKESENAETNQEGR